MGGSVGLHGSEIMQATILRLVPRPAFQPLSAEDTAELERLSRRAAYVNRLTATEHLFALHDAVDTDRDQERAAFFRAKINEADIAWLKQLKAKEAGK